MQVSRNCEAVLCRGSAASGPSVPLDGNAGVVFSRAFSAGRPGMTEDPRGAAAANPSGGLHQHPLVERLKPDPAQPVKRVIELTGLPGESDRPGYQRLYLTSRLEYYAEFPTEDIVHSEILSADRSPFPRLESTRVSVRREATITYTWVRSHQPVDEFDLDVRLGAPSTGRRAVPQDICDSAHSICAGTELCTETCGACTATCGFCTDTCGGGGCTAGGTCDTCHGVTCVGTCDDTCRTCPTDCRQGTCNTCDTQCNQATCAGTCNQATCQTCQTQCGTCDTQCGTCRTQCGTCVACTHATCFNTCAC